MELPTDLHGSFLLGQHSRGREGCEELIPEEPRKGNGQDSNAETFRDHCHCRCSLWSVLKGDISDLRLLGHLGVFQSRTIVPLKMWLLQGNEAAMGALFFFFSQKQLEARFLDLGKRRERCWRTQKNVRASAGLTAPLRSAGLVGSVACER